MVIGVMETIEVEKNLRLKEFMSFEGMTNCVLACQRLQNCGEETVEVMKRDEYCWEVVLESHMEERIGQRRR